MIKLSEISDIDKNSLKKMLITLKFSLRKKDDYPISFAENTIIESL